MYDLRILYRIAKLVSNANLWHLVVIDGINYTPDADIIVAMWYWSGAVVCSCYNWQHGCDKMAVKLFNNPIQHRAKMAMRQVFCE